MKWNERLYLIAVSAAAGVFLVATAVGIGILPGKPPAVSAEEAAPSPAAEPLALPTLSAPPALRGEARDVDVERIRELIEAGRLADREARYWRPSSEPAAPSAKEEAHGSGAR